MTDCTGPLTPSSQLVLDLGPRPTLDNFIAGDNQEALAAARALLDPLQRTTRFMYWWGAPASGRSHLARALAGALRPNLVRLLGPQSTIADFQHTPGLALWLIDDADQLSPAQQEAAFHLFNAVYDESETALASTGAQPPSHTPLRTDLATRLGWGLVLQLKRLSDADTAQALTQTLAERGVVASASLVPWLMTHAARDLGQLRALIDDLDRYALARNRAITLPLLREFLQTHRGTPACASDPNR
jgi:DnaA family protein